MRSTILANSDISESDILTVRADDRWFGEADYVFSRVSIIRSPGDSVTNRERIYRDFIQLQDDLGDARLRPLARAVGVASWTDSSLCGSNKTFIMSHTIRQQL